MQPSEPRLAAAGVAAAPIGAVRAAPVAAAPSRFFAAVVAATLPAECEAAPERVARVVAFVHAQCAALPVALRVLLRVGLLGFRVLVALRFARDFGALDAATRRRVVRAWSYAPLWLARDLFRPLRGPALLAWYDLPAEPGA